ncbi:hypothetical protein [Kordiimonas marina]|uniref:hypothetical protein n=1 Tax=Kordiimonas marina TaxID=2872312 RepID=UPI001FF2FFA6|nr:hypothetical protein [Kordiimonas marina]MCJ9427802.1 hypothetical protein [Kordiimonas marina]
MNFEPFQSSVRSEYQPFLERVLAEMPMSRPTLKTKILERFTDQFERLSRPVLLEKLCNYLEVELEDVNADPTLSDGDVLVQMIGQDIVGVDVRLKRPQDMGGILYGHTIKRIGENLYLINNEGDPYF